MSKLGYTWYPKDWGNSESVFELSLSERGLYRELIDLAMLNDNTTEIKHDVWCRKFAVSTDELTKLLLKLQKLNLITISATALFIPSCEGRLNLSRGGAKGGKNKPTPKPIGKPDPKPTPKQIEIESKIKDTIVSDEIDVSMLSKHDAYKHQCLQDEIWKESLFMQKILKEETIEYALRDYNIHLIQQDDKKFSMKDYKSHFVNWVKIKKEKAAASTSKEQRL